MIGTPHRTGVKAYSENEKEKLQWKHNLSESESMAFVQDFHRKPQYAVKNYDKSRFSSQDWNLFLTFLDFLEVIFGFSGKFYRYLMQQSYFQKCF